MDIVDVKSLYKVKQHDEGDHTEPFSLSLMIEVNNPSRTAQAY